MGRNRRPIIVAFVLTIVAMILINVYTRREEQRIIAENEVKLGMVFIAVDDIQTGTVLTEDLFMQARKPLESLPESRILTMEEFVGKSNTIAIFKDQFLIPDFLEERRVERLSTIIPHNKRAATIAVNRISGVGGHLVPGDNVDIIGAFDEDIAGYPTSLTLFDNVHILAVGLQTQRVSLEGGEEESETAQATNITLSISPQDVKKLVLAENYGELKLALRNENDSNPIPPSALPLPNLLQEMGVDPFAKQKQELEWEKERAYYEALAKGTLDSGKEDEGAQTPWTLQDIDETPQRTIKVFLGSEEKDYFLVDSGTEGLDDLGGMGDGKKSLDDKEKELEDF